MCVCVCVCVCLFSLSVSVSVCVCVCVCVWNSLKILNVPAPTTNSPLVGVHLDSPQAGRYPRGSWLFWWCGCGGGRSGGGRGSRSGGGVGCSDGRQG